MNLQDLDPNDHFVEAVAGGFLDFQIISAVRLQLRLIRTNEAQTGHGFPASAIYKQENVLFIGKRIE